MSKVPTDVIGNIPAYIDAVMKYDESRPQTETYKTNRRAVRGLELQLLTVRGELERERKATRSSKAAQ
eukprot:6519002-Prymnesium_polylepis.1